jgi:GDSL-like Lipase/Acylhydrolase family
MFGPAKRFAPWKAPLTLLRSHPLKVVLVVSVVLALSAAFSRESAAAEWEELPVVPVLGPVVAGHLEKVAARGERFGNRPEVFAKIGDSITASPSFLQAFACQRPQLGGWNELRGTLEFFGETAVPRGSEEAQCSVSNSYSRVGVAAVPGWRAVDALSRLEASPECLDLPAVSCELQLTRPSVALIMFGTNDLTEFTAVQFRRDLARVVRLVSRAGTIPVISTIPPRPRYAQRVARFNAEITALAENRALPLWNYWRQMVAPGVPDEGLGEDGVHPSAQGYALRNFGALRVLDLLRRSVPLGDGR